MSKISEKAKLSKQQIASDLLSEKMSKIWKNSGTKRWCKDCNDWTKAVCQQNGDFFPCSVCEEKEKKEQYDRIEQDRRCEMYQKSLPVQSGKSFLDILKR
jgi:hypothetical protein